MRLLTLLQAGGATVVVLIVGSIVSWAVVLERVLYFKKRSKIPREDFMLRVTGELQKGGHARAMTYSSETDTPFAQVVHTGLKFVGQDEIVVSNAMEREITIETKKLEKRTAITATIGSTAVYVGLFGTVLGIIRAFRDIASSGSGGVNVTINGISEALICTAIGLAVAVPALVAHNYFTKRIDTFVVEMELCASELLDAIRGKRK